MAKTAHCPWCSRDSVPVTDKGGFGNHVDATGKRCIGVGQQYHNEPTRTLPKNIKGTVNRNTKTSKWLNSDDKENP